MEPNGSLLCSQELATAHKSSPHPHTLVEDVRNNLNFAFLHTFHYVKQFLRFRLFMLQCGIILSILMLVLSSFLSRLACHFLLKAAIMARRRNFEFLGKFITVVIWNS
jgi:ABC-type transport system involved in cytochrome bd biosynthesis fused ATPase/permease subunit